MSYQVLARKWRPQIFSELVGQQHVVAAISNALDNNRLHHAYLFTGTRGVGKTTIARIFSKSLNCEKGVSSKPCGVCSTCQEVEQGRYIDLLEIDAASRTKVEDTRELLDNVQYKPSRGEFKVYLIDEVHMLSKHSFNALLKTLEEPPPHVKFLLATTDPQKLPVTILSRCLQFNLKALSREQIVGQLQHILERENIPFESAALQKLARAAQGSMRDALSLTDQAIAQGNGQVSDGLVLDMLGLMDKNQVLRLLNAIGQKQADDVMEQVEHMAMQAVDFEQLLSELMSLLHQVALTQLVPEACKLETTSAKAIYQLAKSIAPEQVQLLYQIAIQGRKDLKFAADSRVGLEMTLLRMLAFVPDGVSMSAVDMTAAMPTPLTVEDSAPLATETQSSVSQQHLEQEQQRIWQQAQVLGTAEQDIEAVMDNDSQPTLEPESIAEGQQPDFLAEVALPVSNDEPEPELQQESPSTTSLSQTEQLLAMRDAIRHSPVQEATPQTETQVTKAQEGGELAKKSSIQTDVEDCPPFPDEIEQPLPGQVDEQADEQSIQQKPAPHQPVVTPEQQQFHSKIDEQVDIDIPVFMSDGSKVSHAAQLDSWSQLIEQIPIQGLTRQLALNASYQQHDQQVTLVLHPQAKHLDTPQSREQLTQALSHALQRNIELVVSHGDPINYPFAIERAIGKVRQQYAERQIHSDPAVNTLIETFAAKVRSGSIEPK